MLNVYILKQKNRYKTIILLLYVVIKILILYLLYLITITDNNAVYL